MPKSSDYYEIQLMLSPRTSHARYDQESPLALVDTETRASSRRDARQTFFCLSSEPPLSPLTNSPARSTSTRPSVENPTSTHRPPSVLGPRLATPFTSLPGPSSSLGTRSAGSCTCRSSFRRRPPCACTRTRCGACSTGRSSNPWVLSSSTPSSRVCRNGTGVQGRRGLLFAVVVDGSSVRGRLAAKWLDLVFFFFCDDALVALQDRGTRDGDLRTLGKLARLYSDTTNPPCRK